MADIALQASKQRRISTLKFGYKDGAIDTDELDKALSSDVGIAIRFNGSQPFSESIQEFTPSNNNLVLHQETEQIRKEAREQVGFSSNQFGEFDKSSRRTASEANIVDRSSQFRMGRRKLRIARCYQQLFEKINPIIFNHWKTPRLIEVIGQDGAQHWPYVTGGSISGEYSYEIIFSDDGPMDTATRRREAAQLYAVLRQDPSINQEALLQYMSQAYNDPQIKALFTAGGQGMEPNANIQLPMQELQSLGGGAGGGGGQGQAAPVPGVQA